MNLDSICAGYVLPSGNIQWNPLAAVRESKSVSLQIVRMLRKISNSAPTRTTQRRVDRLNFAIPASPIRRVIKPPTRGGDAKGSPVGMTGTEHGGSQ